MDVCCRNCGNVGYRYKSTEAQLIALVVASRIAKRLPRSISSQCKLTVLAEQVQASNKTVVACLMYSVVRQLVPQ